MVLLESACASGAVSAPAIVGYINDQHPLVATQTGKRRTLGIYILRTIALGVSLLATTIATDMGRPGFAQRSTVSTLRDRTTLHGEYQHTMIDQVVWSPRTFLLICCNGRSACWQLLTRWPRTHASHAHFSPLINILSSVFSRLSGVATNDRGRVEAAIQGNKPSKKEEMGCEQPDKLAAESINRVVADKRSASKMRTEYQMPPPCNGYKCASYSKPNRDSNALRDARPRVERGSNGCSVGEKPSAVTAPAATAGHRRPVWATKTGGEKPFDVGVRGWRSWEQKRAKLGRWRPTYT